MYSYGSPHMAAQKQDDQHERTFSSYVRIRDVVQKTYLRRWTIGRSGERGSGISVLPARYDDDDDSCCLSHHVLDQVNLWPAWVGFETAIFWQCSPWTVETQRLYLLHHGPRKAIKGTFFWSYKSLSGLPESGPFRIFQNEPIKDFIYDGR